MENIDWIFKLKSQVPNFLKKMESHTRDGYYKYSLTGDFYDEKLKWNIGSSVFALKIFYTLNINDSEKIEKASRYIKSFEKSNAMIYDDYIYRKTFLRNFFSSIKHKNFSNIDNHEYKIAESRQSYSSLLLFNKLPKNIKNIKIPKNENEIDIYLRKLNWNQPWGAGSHFSHLMFFLNLKYITKNIHVSEYEKNLNYSINWINKFQNNLDGTWYSGSTSNRFKINGAMKIITGLNISDKLSINYPEKIIDLCLNSINDESACDNFNIIYVLKYCSQILERTYRQSEIEDFAIKRLKIYRRHYHEKIGGFSFFENKANTNYYNFRISKGINEPDIHGTVLFLWGISIIGQILNINSKLNFQEYKT